MATGSAEYQYNVTGKWWGAVFIDSGEAVNNLAKSDIKTGAGVGVRWASPVGPIKLDIATPWATRTTTEYNFISVWGQNYELV